jgi:hypothetical protein
MPQQQMSRVRGKSGGPRPAGLITLAGDGLSDAPTLPMVPSSWDQD